MKVKFLFLIMFLSGAFSLSSALASKPALVKQPLVNTAVIQQLAHLSVKQIEAITGKKLTLKQKIILKLLKWQLHNKSTNKEKDIDDKAEKKAKWAKWLGIGSLIGLLIPGVNLLSLPAAILAIIFGSQTKNKTSHPKYSKLGITFGIITIGLLLVIGFIVALVTLLPVG